MVSYTPSNTSSPSRTFVTTIAQFQYAYDGNRNIEARTYPSGYQSFTYDSYDRLTSATLPNGTYTYTYDSRSNRLTMRFVNTSLTQDETTSYAYSIDDRMTGYAVFDNINQTTIRYAEYTYDNAGNTTQRVITENGIPSTTSYTYYDDNRIHTVTLPSSEVITFTYFADGSRATKETGTEWITYHYATGLVKEVHHLASDHNTTTFTLHYEPGRIIYEPYGGTPTTYYTVTDTQGTIYKLLDTSGTTVANYTYDPFGNRLTNSAPTIYNPIGFAGTYHDSETNLLYASSRYLDPTTSRFTTKDSYRGDLGSHISQNRYIYCAQNPTSFTDPSGFSPSRENDGTKNLLILHNEDPDSSSSTASSNTTRNTCKTTTNPHTSTPKGNAIQTSPDDVILNSNSAGNKMGPPENKPQMKNPEQPLPKPGDAPVPEQWGNPPQYSKTRFLVNIGGVIVVMVLDNNGNVLRFEGSNIYNMKGDIGDPAKSGAIAAGLNDAMRQSPDAKALLNNPATRNSTLRAIDNFFIKYSDIAFSMYVNSAYPSTWFFRRFAFSTLLGITTATLIRNNAIADPKSADGALYEAITKSINLHAAGMSAYELLCVVGFWTAFHNSSGWGGGLSLEAGGRQLPFKNGGMSGKDDSYQMGYIDLVRVQAGMWAITNSLYSGYSSGSASDNSKKIISNILSLVGIAFGAVLSTGAGVAASVGQEFIGAMLAGTSSAGGGWINNAGITNDIYNKLCERSYLRTSDVWLFTRYDSSTTFAGLGMQAQAMSLFFYDIAKGVNNMKKNSFNGLTLLDVKKASSKYLMTGMALDGDPTDLTQMVKQLFGFDDWEDFEGASNNRYLNLTWWCATYSIVRQP